VLQFLLLLGCVASKKVSLCVNIWLNALILVPFAPIFFEMAHITAKLDNSSE
jgi:hypothetical protein